MSTAAADPFEPATPYAGTSGWSGSDTSEASEIDRRQRQPKVMARLAERRGLGVTWWELGEKFGWHHGQTTGALSALHKDGRVCRLAETRTPPGGRRGSKVYVLPEWVLGRETEAHGGTRVVAE